MLESEPQPKKTPVTNQLSPRVIVMAGGRGTRLEQITGGKIPKDMVTIDPSNKVRGVDRTNEILKEIGLDDITYRANFYKSLYEGIFTNTHIKVEHQEEGVNHGTDLANIMAQRGVDRPYLVLSTDIYFHESDLRKMLQDYAPHTTSWGISNSDFSEMESYRLLMTPPKSLAIVGSVVSPFAQLNLDAHDRYVNGPIMLIDPKQYLDGYKYNQAISGQKSGVDLYRDVGYLLAEINRERLSKGDSSSLNGHIYEKPMIDFGTPGGLFLTRRLYGKN